MLIPNSSYFLMPGFCFVFLAELKQQHQQQQQKTNQKPHFPDPLAARVQMWSTSRQAVAAIQDLEAGGMSPKAKATHRERGSCK